MVPNVLPGDEIAEPAGVGLGLPEAVEGVADGIAVGTAVGVAGEAQAEIRAAEDRSVAMRAASTPRDRVIETAIFVDVRAGASPRFPAAAG